MISYLGSVHQRIMCLMVRWFGGCIFRSGTEGIRKKKDSYVVFFSIGILTMCIVWYY